MDVKPADTLANERTYLAYVRTALSFVAFGFVIARFALFTRQLSLIAHVHIGNAGASESFGIAMAALGAVVAVVGAVRFARTEKALRAGNFSSLSPQVAYLGAVLVMAVGVLVAVDLLSIR